MTKTTIFVAAPISSFEDQSEYVCYRKNLVTLISTLRNMHYEVYSELEKLTSASGYDSPEMSAKKDFERIQRADIFLLFHPKRMQTSTLIELGYACAYAKTIIIVGPRKAVPFLVCGLHAVHNSVYYIDTQLINGEVIQEIQQLISVSKP